MTRDRQIIEKLIKSWAQDHTTNFVVSDFAPTEAAMNKTEGHLTWVIRESHANLDLVSLVDRLEVFLENRKRRSAPDGLFCKKCKIFYQYAESNQSDGSMICYSCRQNPYG